MAPVAAVVMLAAVGCAAARPMAQARGMAGKAAKAGPEPTAGACYDAPIAPRSMWADGTPAVPCTQTHRAETYHLGKVDAPSADGQAQPDTKQILRLFDICEVRAKEFLGADWSSGRVEIAVTLPRPDDWVAGVRAYSCEVFEIDQPGQPAAVRRTSSMRGVLAEPGPLSLGCFDMRNPPQWTPMVPARCDQPHDAEFAGVIARAPIPTGDAEARKKVMLDACEPVVSAFVGALNPRIGWGFDPYGGPIWDAGQMAARCFMVPEEGKKFTASVKGIGARRPSTA
jgi:hypothetical protein